LEDKRSTVWTIKILAANSIAKSPSMTGEDLHGHYLQVSTGRRDRFLILVIPFQLGPKSEPMRPSVKYLHKSFSWGFIKDHIIST
jgi:hypothetical protein